MSQMTPAFSSSLAPSLRHYVGLKRALGQLFDGPTRTLELLDQFLQNHVGTYPDLNAAAFQAWSKTLENLASGVRRLRMAQVYKFCLYRRRTEPQCFVPDPRSFPKAHQRIQPYIFSEQEVARLLNAAFGLKRVPRSPLRPEVIRLAIVLLFRTGLRRKELLRLTHSDYDRERATLLVRESKFRKSRLLPINATVANEIDRYLHARIRRKLPSCPDTPLIWNAIDGGRAYGGSALLRRFKYLLQQCAIVTPGGRLPRVHDARHSFAVNALLRWYRERAEVEAKLPLLTTYMGHASVVATHYYLHWVEPLRTAANEKFASGYGQLVTPKPGKRGGHQ